MIPSFNAEASCYRSRRTYATVATRSRGQSADGALFLTPAEQFYCDGAVCGCNGEADCGDLFGTDLCGPVAMCENTDHGLVCGCIRH